MNWEIGIDIYTRLILWIRKISNDNLLYSRRTPLSALRWPKWEGNLNKAVALVVKNPSVNAGDIEMWIWSLGWENPLEEGMATHSSIPSWRIPWTEEPAGLQSTGSHRVRHDWSDLACTHACSWLTLPYGRNQHNIIKQLYSNKN